MELYSPTLPVTQAQKSHSKGEPGPEIKWSIITGLPQEKPEKQWWKQHAHIRLLLSPAALEALGKTAE